LSTKFDSLCESQTMKTFMVGCVCISVLTTFEKPAYETVAIFMPLLNY